MDYTMDDAIIPVVPTHGNTRTLHLGQCAVDRPLNSHIGEYKLELVLVVLVASIFTEARLNPVAHTPNVNSEPGTRM